VGVTWREVLFLICCGLLTVLFLAVAHFSADPVWLVKHLSATDDGDGILWQVQTTFLSVGFAGLAIAAQLFAEAPLAIGASRGRVLDYIWAGWFVGIGLAANVVIAVETIWLSSELGILVVSFTWFALTMLFLMLSTVRLMRLFGHPSLLDEVVRQSLVDTISSRLSELSAKYGAATRGIDALLASARPTNLLRASATTLRVPVPAIGRVVRAIRPKAVSQAIVLLAPRATTHLPPSRENPEDYLPPEIVLEIDPGDRTRPGETAFRVTSLRVLDEATAGRVIRLLQSSIEFEPQGAVTAYEEIDRDIATLKDAVGTNLRSGAFATAERALELLGEVVRGVWIADPAHTESSRRASHARRDWLFRSVGEVEQDSLLSPRAADMFITSAMKRALEAPRTGVAEYVDECLRSFTRIWSAVLQSGGPEYDAVRSRIVTCVQNLAAYAFPTADKPEDLQARGVWAMVELVKTAVDANRPRWAESAAEELAGLFEFDRTGSGRAHVRAGQLVLSGWFDYLTARNDSRAPADGRLRGLVTARGKAAEILAAKEFAARGRAPFTQWDWWEMESGGTSRVRTLQLPTYIDRAEVAALAMSRGSLPPAENQDRASEYSRFLEILGKLKRELTPEETRLQQLLVAQIANWDAQEATRLAKEPLSDVRIEAIRTSLRESLARQQRLAALIPVVDDIPAWAETSRPVLGMNFRVPREFLVDEVFTQTHADPAQLGEIIARGFEEGEDHRAVDTLRAMEGESLPPTSTAIMKSIESLGSDAVNFVLLTPYEGLDDLGAWYSDDFREILERVTHIETAVLDNEAILFDRRSTLSSSRHPEEKDGLSPVEGTSISLGVFEDVSEAAEGPELRVETGEYFVVWPGEQPRVLRFRQEPDGDAAIDADMNGLDGIDVASMG
jgi:hypothetical protein